MLTRGGVAQWVARLTPNRCGYLSVVSSSPIKGPVVSLSKTLYSHCLVLVVSRNGFERDLHMQIIACFTTKIN